MINRSLTFLAITISLITETVAQDRHFAWTYESVTLPKGGLDIEPWFTYSTGRNEYYSRLATRLEFELGLTNHLQTAFYLNAKHSAEATMDSASNITGLLKKSSFSVSNEWKLNILNPSTDLIGLGLYAEYTLLAHEVELEFKLLIDKRTAKNIIAFNHVWELEFEKQFEQDNGAGAIETERKIMVEHDLAWSHLFRPEFGLGIELRNHNVISGGALQQAVLFGGPSLFWSHTQDNAPGFFVIFTPLYQITNLMGAGGKELTEHEQWEARVLLGLSF